MKPRREVLEAALFIIRSGLAYGTWGNVSLLHEGLIYITPSGIPYEELTEDDIAIVDLEGNLKSGYAKPSSELPLHLQIYKDHSEVRAIVHTHSIKASAFSAMRRPIPCYLEDQAMIIGGTIEVAEYALPGTWNLAKNASKALGEKFGVLLANHGAVAVGRSMKEALVAAQIIEKSAEIALLAGNEGIPLKDEDIRALRKKYLESYSKHLK